jgi:hypothetical protein
MQITSVDEGVETKVRIQSLWRSPVGIFDRCHVELGDGVRFCDVFSTPAIDAISGLLGILGPFTAVE